MPRRCAFQTRSEAISLPLLIVTALVHAGVVVTLAEADRPYPPEVSPPAVTKQVEMIAPTPATPVAPARVEETVPLPQPVKREIPRPKQPTVETPTPSQKANEVIAAPDALAAADAPAMNVQECAAPRAEAAASTKPAQVEATQAHFDADYLNNPTPSYPAMSRRLGEEGRAEQVELKSRSGFPHLDQAAEDAVRHWKFVPARRGDEVVATWVAVPIVFNLHS